MNSFLNTIILLGALQGFIISLLLFFPRSVSLPNKLLAWLILLMSMASLNLYFLHTGSFTSTETLRIIADVVPLIVMMPMGPLLFFYVRGSIDPGFRITNRHRWHFVPLIIDVVPQLCFILFYFGRSAGWWRDERPWINFTDGWFMYSDIPRWVSLTLYTLMAGRYLSRQTSSTVQQVAVVKWLRQFINVFLVFQAIWLLFLIPYIIPGLSEWLMKWMDWYPLYLPIAGMIYWLGIKGYTFTLQLQTAERSARRTATDILPEKLATVLQLLHSAMERDRIYLNPALNLERVSVHTGIAPKMISAVLNQHIGKSFSEWMNEYRISEFKKRLNQANLQQLTISGIAAECGFNSQATFQRIFKQSVGATPTEYLKSVGKTG